MIADRVRMNAHWKALQQAITSESVVLDIGCGVGIMTMLACRAGAKRVYAIEPEDWINTAKKLAAVNGFSNKIEFIQGLSSQITLPERADVIVSDLRGVLPLFQHHLPDIVDARERLLAPDGQLIPESDQVWAAVVEAPEVYKLYEEPWKESTSGLDLSAAEQLAKNAWRKARFTAESLLSEPVCWAALHYQKVTDPDVKRTIELTIARPGTAHGLAVWFDALLLEGCHYSNSPSAPPLVYGQAFFPWLEHVDVLKGDKVSLEMAADLVGSDYIWRWNTTVTRPGDASFNFQFRQSTLHSWAGSFTQLRKRAESYVPHTTADAKIDNFILSKMDGKTESGQIARQLLSNFPQGFADYNEALSRVANLIERY